MTVDISWLMEQAPLVQALLGLVAMCVLAYLARWLVHTVLRQGVGRWVERLQGRWAQVVLHRTVLRRLSQIVPSLVIQTTVGLIPHLPAMAVSVIQNVAVAVTVLHVVRILMALLDAVQEDHERSGSEDALPTRPIKSHIQLGKLALILIGTLVIIAALIDRSPLILLSGLGAMSAVLLLVFKDTLLSFTAGLQLASNDMLRVGDWIEMPQLGADGDVIDIALHTVKVQNWDKTITTIPTWRLMSESFRNWRGMSEAGGRRIKRTFRLDAGSVRFLAPPDIERLKHIALLRPYLERKLLEVQGTNTELSQKLGDLAKDPANLRRLTNLGTLRAYIEAYLRQHPAVHQDMTLMVRAMEPSAQGVPMEVYCFTASTEWLVHEGVQSDIFDHLLAILPEFGLRLFQEPTGNDITAGLRSASARPATESPPDPRAPGVRA